MKRNLLCGVLALLLLSGLSGEASANSEGWDQGFYLSVGAGYMQVNNDSHVITGSQFSKNWEPALANLTIGWDATMWVRPLLSMTYTTATSSVGNAGAAVGAFPAGTFPRENAREHVLDITLANRFTLPYFVEKGNDATVKFLPYLKVGGTAHALFVNASTDANKVGAFGGGPAVGIGAQINVWKGLFFNIDATEHLIFQKAYKTTVAGTPDTKVTDGGFKPRFAVLGSIGWHFQFLLKLE